MTMTVNVIPRRSGQTRALKTRFAAGAPNLAYHFAQRVVSYSKASAPVRTGNLKNSIKRTRLALGSHKVEVGAFYGIYVNYGTRYMHAQPFWEPSITLATIKLRKEMADLMHGNKIEEVPDDNE